MNKNATANSYADTSMPMPYKSFGGSGASIKENQLETVPIKTKANNNMNNNNNYENFYKKIVWKKDGENVSRDALFNLR